VGFLVGLLVGFEMNGRPGGLVVERLDRSGKYGRGEFAVSGGVCTLNEGLVGVEGFCTKTNSGWKPYSSLVIFRGARRVKSCGLWDFPSLISKP